MCSAASPSYAASVPRLRPAIIITTTVITATTATMDTMDTAVVAVRITDVKPSYIEKHIHTIVNT